VFRGFFTVSIDAKGRVALPTRFREQLRVETSATVIMTVNPWDRCLWFYPLAEWERVDTKLLSLPDGDPASRRAKQVLRGYATDCEFDGQGRILVSGEHRNFAGLQHKAALLGQGNKLELWDAGAWERQRDEWLAQIDSRTAPVSGVLQDLSL
jgi:MraZ protein